MNGEQENDCQGFRARGGDFLSDHHALVKRGKAQRGGAAQARLLGDSGKAGQVLPEAREQTEARLEEGKAAKGRRRPLRIAAFLDAFHREVNEKEERALALRRDAFHEAVRRYGLKPKKGGRGLHYSFYLTTIDGYGLNKCTVRVPDHYAISRKYDRYKGKIRFKQGRLLQKELRAIEQIGRHSETRKALIDRIFGAVRIERIPRVEPSERAAIPRKLSVYFFFDHGGAVHYVGQSADVRKRWISHRKYWKETASIGWIEVEGNMEALLCEQYFIKKLRPRNNKVGNPDYMQAKREACKGDEEGKSK